MDEDYDAVLVIDFDDEKEEKHDPNIDEELRPINDNYNKSKSAGQHSYEELQETGTEQSHNDKQTEDDHIQVIDDDENCENSVQKYIYAANNEPKDYRIHKRHTPEHKKSNIRGTTNQIHNHKPYRKNVIGTNERDRVVQYVKDNGERNGNRAAFETRYDINERESFTNVPLPCGIDAVPHAYINHDTNRPDVVRMDDYYHLINRNDHSHIHRPEIPLYDFYIHRPINRTYIHHAQRPVLSTDASIHSEMIRDPYNHIYRPDVFNTDEYRRAEIRAPHLYTHRPYDINHMIRLDGRAVERDAYSYSYRENEIARNNDYRYDMRNRLPYNHYNNYVYDHWRYRDNITEGVISIEDYERSIRNGRVYNAYDPPLPLSLDPYRSVELANIYRPDYVSMEAYREPMFVRNAYPETAGMHGYRPVVSPYRTEVNGGRRNREDTLNLSHKQERNNVISNRLRDESVNVKKTKAVLNTGTQSELPLNLHKTIQKSEEPDITGQTHRRIADDIRKNKTLPGVNVPDEIHMDVCKPEVLVNTNRLNTVILSTGNIYQKNTLSHSVIVTEKPITDRRHDVHTTTGKKIKDESENAENNKHQIDKTRERKGRDYEDINVEEKDDNIRFLVVFFTRVKELVKYAFPEFSKSLEKEIENLGARTSSGRIKTDIQYICPLYCSVSTYSFPRFDNSDDDNKIEKHVNRTKICDVCSCIQNCYKLYKRKYYNLITAVTGEKQDVIDKMNETNNVNVPIDGVGAYRAQTVICRLKATDRQETAVDKFKSNSIDMHEELLDDHVHSNIGTTINKYNSILGPERQTTTSLNEQRLLHSLSVLNFNLPNQNTEKSQKHNNIPIVSNDKDISLHNPIDDRHMEIENPDQNTDKEEIFNKKVNMDSNITDRNEANLILSLSFNDITNADIMASKLKDNINRKPDTVFTCHICTCIFTYFTSFLSHMQKEHNLNEIDKDIPEECITRKCPFCGIYSKRKHHNEHVKKEHPEIFTQKVASETDPTRVNKKRKSWKRKFIFICLVCHKNLKSTEVKRHREIEHKGLKVEKMFTKKLSTMD